MESGNEGKSEMQVKVEPQVKQDSSAEGVEDTTEITDEEVKAYWLSGIAALHQVNLLSQSPFWKCHLTFALYLRHPANFRT